jgi:hypothetical protein
MFLSSQHTDAKAPTEMRCSSDWLLHEVWGNAYELYPGATTEPAHTVSIELALDSKPPTRLIPVRAVRCWKQQWRVRRRRRAGGGGAAAHLAAGGGGLLQAGHQGENFRAILREIIGALNPQTEKYYANDPEAFKVRLCCSHKHS